MSTQHPFSFDDRISSPPERRLDLTFERLGSLCTGMEPAERLKASLAPWWPWVQLLWRVRQIEREQGGASSGHLADLYDRLVAPGDELVPSLLRVVKAAYGRDVPPTDLPKGQ
jgi:hypothetical protein